jgi:hypothetical protein
MRCCLFMPDQDKSYRRVVKLIEQRQDLAAGIPEDNLNAFFLKAFQ